MKRVMLGLGWIVLAMLLQSASVAAAVPSEMSLTTGWRVTQDVRELGERTEWYKPDYAADWQPIDRLVHLQLLLAKQPYFGRNLRSFNIAPWWYRLEFSTPDLARQATLRFEGVDYFAKVWVNGTLLGEHEGYAQPFEFEVARALHKDRPNVLVVKVSSPWDQTYTDPKQPEWTVVRNLLKGSYEHADTFVQRDVNPIGIWRPVRLMLHDELRTSEQPTITYTVSSDQRQAHIKAVWPVFNAGAGRTLTYVLRIREHDTKKEVARSQERERIFTSPSAIALSFGVPGRAGTMLVAKCAPSCAYSGFRSGS